MVEYVISSILISEILKADKTLGTNQLCLLRRYAYSNFHSTSCTPEEP